MSSKLCPLPYIFTDSKPDTPVVCNKIDWSKITVYGCVKACISLEYLRVDCVKLSKSRIVSQVSSAKCRRVKHCC